MGLDPFDDYKEESENIEGELIKAILDHDEFFEMVTITLNQYSIAQYQRLYFIFIHMAFLRNFMYSMRFQLFLFGSNRVLTVAIA